MCQSISAIIDTNAICHTTMLHRNGLHVGVLYCIHCYTQLFQD